MLRQLLIIALLLAAYWLYRRLRQRLTNQRRQQSRAKPLYQATVRCAHCGLYVPLNKAFGGDREGYFCSEEHRRIGRSPRDDH